MNTFKKGYILYLIIFIVLIIYVLYKNLYKKNVINFKNQNEIIDTSDIISDNNINNAYVINLLDRNDRWEQINNTFKNSKINLIRVPAIKRKNGHLGCGLSFVKIVKYAKENNLKTVLIFEDDNMPLKDFDNRWFIIKKWLDNNLDKWEVFNGGARFIDWQSYKDKEPDPNDYNVELLYKINNNEYLFQSDIMVSENWLYINSSCYDKVLDWQYNNKSNTSLIPMDQYITKKEYFNHVYCIPHLALQHNSESDTSHYDQALDKYDNSIIELFNKIYKNTVSSYYIRI